MFKVVVSTWLGGFPTIMHESELIDTYGDAIEFATRESATWPDASVSVEELEPGGWFSLVEEL